MIVAGKILNQIKTADFLREVTLQLKASETAMIEQMEDSQHSQVEQNTNVSRLRNPDSSGARPKRPLTMEKSERHGLMQGAPLSQEMEEVSC